MCMIIGLVYLYLISLTLFDGAVHCCIDDEHLQSCDALRTDPIFQLSTELFARHFLSLTPIIYFFAMILSGGLHYYYSLNADKWSSGGRNTPQQRQRCTYLSKVTGSIQALSMLLSAYSFRFVFIESCKYSIVNQSEAAAFCGTLSSCGLALASVYTINWIGVCCALILDILGIVIVTINTFHLPLLLSNDLYITLMGPFDLNRLGILTTHSYQLSLALETASTEYINCYLTDWQRIQRRPPVNNIRAILTTAYNYGALDDLY